MALERLKSLQVKLKANTLFALPSVGPSSEAGGCSEELEDGSCSASSSSALAVVAKSLPPKKSSKSSTVAEKVAAKKSVDAGQDLLLKFFTPKA